MHQKQIAGPVPAWLNPLVKKGGDAAHEMLFAALFGGVVAAETDTDPMVGGLAPINADADTDANPDGNSDILAAMQAVAAMMSGQRGTGRSSGSEADAASPVDAVLVDEDDLAGLDGEPGEDMISSQPDDDWTDAVATASWHIFASGRNISCIGANGANGT